MNVSFCRHEKNGDCGLLTVKCEPGRKGCVLVKGKYKFAENPKSKIKNKESNK